MMGSSNLTANALVTNHEWNLKVSASVSSDLGMQLANLVNQQIAESVPLTQQWIDIYRDCYVQPALRPARTVQVGPPPAPPPSSGTAVVEVPDPSGQLRL